MVAQSPGAVPASSQLRHCGDAPTADITPPKLTLDNTYIDRSADRVRYRRAARSHVVLPPSVSSSTLILCIASDPSVE